jgi:hypothetical protein
VWLNIILLLFSVPDSLLMTGTTHPHGSYTVSITIYRNLNNV